MSKSVSVDKADHIEDNPIVNGPKAKNISSLLSLSLSLYTTFVHDLFIRADGTKLSYSWP